ncbi:MAG: N-(5'-phosphoribosyl)anthranilate isomerase [Saprospiraceae bacterium]|nr:N-(5'-phosphoribosyl)anthranilate isomerase [Saprospiraceae bacterium]
MLKIKVKANSITNLTDARYFAAREVTWMGFCLDPASEDYIAPQKVSAICEWLDSVKIVGEFPLADPLEILETAEQLNLNAVQVHRFTDLDDLNELQRRIPVIQEMVVATDEDPAALADWMANRASLVEAFLLDFGKNRISWPDNPGWQEWLKTTCKKHPVVLNMDFQPDELPEILNALPLYGLAVQGGEEEKTGIKSFDELDSLLELLELSEEHAVE